MLALKLLLVPMFLALITLAARRWGPRFAGWIAGLPVIAGPILAIIAVEQGPVFAGQAAGSAVMAVVITVVFCLAYAVICVRLSWLWALMGAWLIWGGAAWGLQAGAAWLPSWWTVAASSVVTLSVLVLAPYLFPRVTLPTQARAATRGDIGLRMLAGAALTLFVTTLAQRLGPSWSGVMTLFPVMSVVLAVFSHRQQGAAIAVTMLRSLVSGLYSLVAFCATLAWAWSSPEVVQAGGPLRSLTGVLMLGVAMALTAQLASRWVLTRLNLWVH